MTNPHSAHTDVATSRPGVTITPLTKRDADGALRSLSAATAPFFRSGGPLAVKRERDQ